LGRVSWFGKVHQGKVINFLPEYLPLQEQDDAFHTAAVDFYEACVIWLIEIHRRFIEEL